MLKAMLADRAVSVFARLTIPLSGLRRGAVLTILVLAMLVTAGATGDGAATDFVRIPGNVLSALKRAKLAKEPVGAEADQCYADSQARPGAGFRALPGRNLSAALAFLPSFSYTARDRGSLRPLARRIRKSPQLHARPRIQAGRRIDKPVDSHDAGDARDGRRCVRRRYSRLPAGQEKVPRQRPQSLAADEARAQRPGGRGPVQSGSAEA